MSKPDLPTLTPQTPMPRFVTARVISALILREMATRFGRTPGGYLWAILQPVVMISLLTTAFSTVLRTPSLGTSFLLFYATGYLPLRMFQEVSEAVGTAMQFHKSLMAYPRVTYFDSLLARALLSILTQITVAILVIAGILITQPVVLAIDAGTIACACAAAFFFALGVGALNCYLSLSYPLYRTLWNTLKTPLILVSTVFYIFEDLPASLQSILWFNPLVHIAGLMRQGFFGNYVPSYISMTYVSVWSCLPLMFGLIFLRRHGRDLLYK